MIGVMLPPWASTLDIWQSLYTYLEKEGYDFVSVGLCVCLFVSNITQNGRIAMKFYGQARGNSIKNYRYIYIYIYFFYTKILEVNLFAFAYRLFRRDFSPLDGTYCMGTHSFLQPYIHFVLIWEGFMNGQSWSLLLQFSVLIS